MSTSIIVTGGAGALGSAVVRHLVGLGRRVVALDHPRTDAKLAALSAELGGACLAVAADVSTAAGWKGALEQAARLGPAAGAVLTVGGWVGGEALVSEADETFERMMGSNLGTVHAALRALLPGMVARSGGSVVVIGSRVVERPWSGAGAASYTASKAGAVALAQAAAAEVLEAGVRVNAVLPSTIDTAANRAAMPGADASKWVAPEAIAKVIAFLLSDDSAPISGAAIPVYGRA
jgi:NAD(P)-dependent dehydrogenase (short-subunit alcohol dehydrogenase family)